MGTRAVITFKSMTESFAVYVHTDGVPENIIPALQSAKQYAWPLPRFEAEDFAAAFIAAHKPPCGGAIYCTTCAADHDNLAFHYVVTADGASLFVEAHDHYSGQPYKIHHLTDPLPSTMTPKMLTKEIVWGEVAIALRNRDIRYLGYCDAYFRGGRRRDEAAKEKICAAINVRARRLP